MTMATDRSRPPAPGPAPRVELDVHAAFTLASGLRAIVVENHKLPLVSVQLRFDVPPIVQGDKAGCIELVGELLASGTALRGKAAIDEEVDRLGAALSTSSEGLYAMVLKRNLPALLDVVRDVVTGPTFPEPEFATARDREVSHARQRRDDPEGIAEVVGRSVTYGPGHPYGEVVSEDSLARVATGHLRAYHRRWFRPAAGCLVFVGDITEAEARVLAEEHLAGWDPGPLVPRMNADGTEEVEGLGPVRVVREAVTASRPRRALIVDRPGAPQSVLRVSFPLDLHPGDPRLPAAQVMNTILGGAVFSARLMANLREDKGWTYGAYSQLEAERFSGAFTASVSVRTPVTGGAVGEILGELERMRGSMVSVEELGLAKSHLAGSFARALEDPRTLARFALNTWLNGLPEDHYATYLERLAAVTAEDVRAAGEAFLLPDRAAVLVVGDKAAIGDQLLPLALDTADPLAELDHNGEPVPTA